MGGRLPAGSVDDRLVATIDITPTVLAAAGVDPDAGDPADGTRPALGAELAAPRGCVGETGP